MAGARHKADHYWLPGTSTNQISPLAPFWEKSQHPGDRWAASLVTVVSIYVMKLDTVDAVTELVDIIIIIYVRGLSLYCISSYDTSLLVYVYSTHTLLTLVRQAMLLLTETTPYLCMFIVKCTPALLQCGTQLRTTHQQCRKIFVFALALYMAYNNIL